MENLYTDKEVLKFLQSHRLRLMSYLTKVSGSSLKAELAYTELLCAVVNICKEMTPEKPITEKYIYGIAKNKAVDMFRKKALSIVQSVTFHYMENGEIKVTNYVDVGAEIKLNVARHIGMEKYVNKIIKRYKLKGTRELMCRLLFLGYDLENGYEYFEKLLEEKDMPDMTKDAYLQMVYRLTELLQTIPNLRYDILHTLDIGVYEELSLL